MQLTIAPSVLSADFLNLGKEVEMLNKYADLIHLDIMDGTFVPNISFGFPVVEAIARNAKIPMDAHLMVVKPQRWFNRLAELGVKMVSFHYEESPRSTLANIRAIQALGMEAGVAINPDIPVSKLYPFVGKADFFLIMSVFAGFGGQKFIYESLDKIVALKEKMKESGIDSPIEVDGGVGLDNAAALKEAGARILVSGNTIFKSSDPVSTISKLRI